MTPDNPMLDPEWMNDYYPPDEVDEIEEHQLSQERDDDE